MAVGGFEPDSLGLRLYMNTPRSIWHSATSLVDIRRGRCNKHITQGSWDPSWLLRHPKIMLGPSTQAAFEDCRFRSHTKNRKKNRGKKRKPSERNTMFDGEIKAVQMLRGSDEETRLPTLCQLQKLTGWPRLPFQASPESSEVKTQGRTEQRSVRRKATEPTR